MNRKTVIGILLLASFILCARMSFAQSCDCKQELIYVKQRIEQNYAGFKDKVVSSKLMEYGRHTEIQLEKAVKIDDPFACAVVIREWLAYFQDGHIQLNYDRVDFSDLSSEEIRTFFSSTKRFDKWNEKKVIRYLNKNELDPIEGIWQNASGSYRTAIIKDPSVKQASKYVGIILKADSVYWMPGQMKVEISKNSEGMTADYYYRDHHPEKVEVNLYGDEVLEFEGLTQWRKQHPEAKEKSTVEVDPNYFRNNNPRLSPSFKLLYERTALLTLPSFAGQHALIIDSLISVHFSDITSSENLLIDLRGNPGGSDFCYAPIIPILYTNPIFTDGASYIQSEFYRAVEVDEPYEVKNINLPVAVIIDGVTASSGEAAAIAFFGMENVRFFGRPSCGLSTANRGYELTNGGMLLLTVSTMADRNQVPFGDKILPDESFDDNAIFNQRVVEWLNEQ